MKLNVSECYINGLGHLADKDNKTVVVQVGRELFFLSMCRTLKGPDDLKKCLVKYNMVLLKEE